MDKYTAEAPPVRQGRAGKLLSDVLALAVEVIALRAENERLRGAFRKIEVGLDFIAADDTTEDARMAARLLPIARAALATAERS